MTTTDAAPIIEEEERVRHSKQRCGYCATGNHQSCARTIRNGKVNNADRLHTCSCKAEGCPAQQPRCMDCRNEVASEINIYTMLCEDRDSCLDVQAVRRDKSPVFQQLKEIKEKVMAEQAEKPARAKAAPKVGKCLVTGKPTKGGNFLPGMDARYVSLLVTDVQEGKATVAQARKRITDETKSEKLLAKFDKSNALATEKADKKKADAKAKAEAKKEAEKVKAEAKA